MTGDKAADPNPLAAHSLAQSKLFGALSDDDRLWVLDHVEPARFKAGATIFARGEDADGLYILQSGGVGISFETSDGRTFSIAIASVGAVFGEIAVLDGGLRSADATAMTDVDTLKMSSETVKAVLAANPRVADAVIRFLCARVRDTDQKLEAIALQSVEARLARFLLSAVRRTRGPAKGKVAIMLGVSPSDLSLLIGEGRTQVRAALDLLEAAHAFHRNGDEVVCDVAILARIADQGWD